MGWYESYGGKKVVNMVYCLGASVVIIGALFKILHWPGASQVLMVGMFTEAFLFGIGCLDKPHVDFHWEEVFPQLLGYGAEPEKLEELARRPKPTLLGNMGGGAAGGSPGGGRPAGCPPGGRPCRRPPSRCWATAGAPRGRPRGTPPAGLTPGAPA